MSSNQTTNCESSSPILDMLDKFRYKRSTDSAFGGKPSLSNSGSVCNDVTDRQDESPETATTNGITMVSETPEHMVNKSSKSEDSMNDSSQENDTPIKFQRRVKRMISSDSDSDSENIIVKRVKDVPVSPLINDEDPLSPDPAKPRTVSISTKSTLETSPDKNCKSRNQNIPGPLRTDIFSGKEIGLQMMMKAFPKIDLMILQDTLARCGWYAKKAIHVMQEDCDPYSCPHFKIPVFTPKVKPKIEPISPTKMDQKSEDFPKTIYIKPDPDAPPLDINSDVLEQLTTIKNINSSESLTNYSSSESQHQSDDKQLVEPLLVPKLEPIDDTSLDSEKVPVETKDDSSQDIENVPSLNFKVVRRRIHQLSSDDSDDGLGQIKMVSMATLQKAAVTIEKPSITRKAVHEISGDEGAEGNPDKCPSGNSKKREPKRKKKKKRKDLEACSEDEQDYSRDDLYNSEDSDIDETLTPARDSVLTFYRNASHAELLTVPGLSKKKVDTLVHCRPFASWVDLVTKLQRSKHLTTDMLASARDVIVMRDVMAKLMQRCEKIATDMEKVVIQLNSGGSRDLCITEQPGILTKNLQLAPYQMLGLNWLWVMHQNRLNGILADEMGLGKTIQAIAFMAHLKQEQDRAGNHKKNGPPRRHLIIVPSSTMDNWVREFHIWCPSMNVITYHGSQESRRELRLQIVNQEIEDFDAMITTYNMVSSSIEDRTLFRRLNFHYVIFDEAHMLKNMATQRYQNLMKIQAERRLLLTGTPLQNNLVELMSLLIFVMPGMFYGKVDQVKQMFSSACKSEENRSAYEKERIEHAKRIMKPFVLRRLKKEVLTQLPSKHEQIEHCNFTEYQKEAYSSLIETFSKRMSEEMAQSVKSSGVTMMMELRKAANHPLLVRKKFTDQTLRTMSKKMIQEPTHCDASPQLIFEDMQIMSDFELHRLCKNFKSISSFQLKTEDILDSGKFRKMDIILPALKEKGSRFLLFSQFTMMLDIVEEYMDIRKYSFLRLDGSTPVTERQELMDKYNGDSEIFAFLLSTKAGGLGINLTAANVVLLHDIDFNPYNDKQAEDRCHRLGQTREVTVKRMIMKDSIEEAILKCAQDKLKLEKDITQESEDKEEEVKTVSNLLKTALGL